MGRTDSPRPLRRFALHHARVGTGVHDRVLHLHRRFRDDLGDAAADVPTANGISAQTLPLSAGMPDRDVEDVIGVLLAVLEQPREEEWLQATN